MDYYRSHFGSSWQIVLTFASPHFSIEMANRVTPAERFRLGSAAGDSKPADGFQIGGAAGEGFCYGCYATTCSPTWNALTNSAGNFWFCDRCTKELQRDAARDLRHSRFTSMEDEYKQYEITLANEASFKLTQSEKNWARWVGGDIEM